MPLDKCQGRVECPVCRTSHLPAAGALKDGVYAATCQSCGHFFKFRAIPPLRSQIAVTINGKQYTVGNEYSASTSLNEFLRSSRASVGTKYMCREGGCGMCVVEAKLYEPITEQKLSYAITQTSQCLSVLKEYSLGYRSPTVPLTNAPVVVGWCQCPLFVCDGWEITTTEGIGSPRTELHPVQQRLADYNGSQCGFCSSAQVMNMYSLLQHTPQPTEEMVEDVFDGVTCRCTGYRSILAAMKSFCPTSKSDESCTITDIEDVGRKLCKRTGQRCHGNCSSNDTSLGLHMVLRDAQWLKPITLEELYSIMKQYKDKSMRLTFGSTGWGVFKELGPWMYEVLIDLHGIREMYDISFDPDAQIGANITLTQMIDIFDRVKSDDPQLPYLGECVKFLKRCAHTNVRNVGSWAGNLIMKQKHPEFVSDVFTMLETVGAQIGLNDEDFISPLQLLSTDMTGKVITYMILGAVEEKTITKFYKVGKRAQNAHGYVNAGFQILVDKENNFLVKKMPSLVYAGINKSFVHATMTEQYLTGKNLNDPSVIKGALVVLQQEVKPDSDPVGASPAYRTSLALGLFYKFILHVLGDSVPTKLRSGGTQLVRPLSSGQQSYDTKEIEWPLTQPITKLEAKAQVSGEAVYVNDIPPRPAEVYAAFAISSVASAKIQNIDTSAAKQMPGVIAVLTSKDLPPGGVNNCMPSPYDPEEVLCSETVMYAGQPVALVIADGEQAASSAAGAVKVTYTEVKTPVLTIPDAVQKGMIFPKQADDIVVGDAETAISQAAHKIAGSVSAGTQYHYQMETQISICVPTEDGMLVHASTQWPDYCQKAVALVTGLQSASIEVDVKRCGGAYGSKITQNFKVAAACALAAYTVNRPVRLNLNFHTNMEMMGKRFPYQANYQAGFTDEGKLSGVRIEYYCDCGYSKNDCTVNDIMHWGDNAYHCDNWHLIPIAVQTNTASNTYCRAPASTPGIFFMETIMEHVAQTLGKDPTEVKMANLYQKGQVTPAGMTLHYCSISTLMTDLMQSSEVQSRQQAVQAFNTANRWKKKGLSVVPMKYGVNWIGQNYGVLINVYSQDGTVSVSHGGVEVGQGINTKVAQVCAYELGIPVDLVKVCATNTVTCGGNGLTGSSITSELCCQATVEACQIILQNMAPVKAKMSKPTWLAVVQQCFNDGVDLSAHSWLAPHQSGYYQYNSYGVTCTEVELDVLTGQHQIERVDMLFDCGESINPKIDIGQVEGAFVMGLGYWLTEQSIYDPESGKLLTNNTWEYKPPLPKDIPIDFRIHLLKNAPNPLGVLRSKASGEPPLCMSCSALFALKHAVFAAREDAGNRQYFQLNGPATCEFIQMSCLNNPSQFIIT